MDSLLPKLKEYLEKEAQAEQALDWLRDVTLKKVEVNPKKGSLQIYLEQDALPSSEAYQLILKAFSECFNLPEKSIVLPVARTDSDLFQAINLALDLLYFHQVLPERSLIACQREADDVFVIESGSVLVMRGLEKRQISMLVKETVRLMTGKLIKELHLSFSEAMRPKGEPVEGLAPEPVSYQQPSPAKSNPATRKRNHHKILKGKNIAPEADSISNITEEERHVIIQGEVFHVDARLLKSGRYLIKFSLTDHEDSMSCTLFCEKEEYPQFSDAIVKGVHLKVRGHVREDRYTHELTLSVHDINIVETSCEIDLAEEKRVELHLHTQMSDMDAVSSLEELIKTAKNYGHHSIAITDHGVIQAFPEAYALGKKYGVKIIYGIEAYIFDDRIPENQKPRNYHCILLAQNMEGLRNIYKLVTESHLRYFKRRPRIPKRLVEYAREGLIVGSACEAGELIQHVLQHPDDWQGLKDLAEFYDYIEIQPIANNGFMIDKGWVEDAEGLRDINRKLDKLAKEVNKPLVATCDVHFASEKDGIFRSILMASRGFQDAENQTPLYYRTTTEMLDEFSYLGEERAYEAVVENTNKIAATVEELQPIPDHLFAPEIQGAEQQIIDLTLQTAKKLYGSPLPEIVQKRIDKELDSIINNGFAVLYLIAHKLVKKSNQDGYLVGSRGSVGSSVVAFLTGITEVNALPPHYRCPKCTYAEFYVNREYGAGIDMPDKKCPHCGTQLAKDGFDIPFEIFLGFKGDKVPDIDLNFSGEYQPEAHRFTESLFGLDNVFRAGTIATVKEKTALGYVFKFSEDLGLHYRACEVDRLKQGCTGVKRTTGQHPGGLMVVPKGVDVHEFTPLQRPANDTKTETVTTHFDYHSISERLVKLDILGHDDPTVINMLEKLTGIDIADVPLDDPATLTLFSSTEALNLTPEKLNSTVATYGIPEFNTHFTRKMLEDTKPASFADLVRISGYSHGTDVWLNNAQDLIRNKIAPVSDTISTRDDIMLYLSNKGMEEVEAFKIMESVRKGRGLTADNEQLMRAVDTPAWFIESCKKIKYLFPKAHAVAYVTMAYRIAWFKINYPLAFYASYFTVRGLQDFDLETIIQGEDQVRAEIKRIYTEETRTARQGKRISDKDAKKITVLEVALELYCRGFQFKNVDLDQSDATTFKIVDNAILPPLVTIPNLGKNMAESIVAAREEEPFSSIADMKSRGRVGDSMVEMMASFHILDHLPAEDQMSFF